MNVKHTILRVVYGHDFHLNNPGSIFNVCYLYKFHLTLYGTHTSSLVLNYIVTFKRSRGSRAGNFQASKISISHSFMIDKKFAPFIGFLEKWGNICPTSVSQP